MPIAAITPAVATLIGGAIAGGTTAYGVHAAGKSQTRASQVQQQADAQTLQLEQQRDAEAKRQWDIQQAFQQQQFNAQEEDRLHTRQLQDEREARLAPYRQASAAAMGRLGDFLGLSGHPAVMTGGGGGSVAPVVTGNTLTFQRRPPTLGAAVGLQ